MVDRHGAELVADFQRHYAMRLSDVVAGAVSPKSALAMVEHLPEDSAFVAAVRGGREFAGWDTVAYMLAALIDSVNMTTWAVFSQNAKRPPSKPQPFERPGKRKRTIRAAETLLRHNPHAVPIPEHRLPKP
ncbi:hypothetical protein TR51_25510 [Kitasatospora griseola]|uniref:Uncharacterized protein n=1 Tax=Kitasatospora griseola TaxID=2064 RepID=A0A0D0PPK5_KITGR|nr:hypothetical protein [Kitasatospora griseola]KIQ62402.1 hypothetical protein TR51_25510 [Kitasatospora griseola]